MGIGERKGSYIGFVLEFNTCCLSLSRASPFIDPACRWVIPAAQLFLLPRDQAHWGPVVRVLGNLAR